MKIFETYATSHPKVLNQRVVDLCLVGAYWNKVANITPQLWTKINLSFPFSDPHLAAALKRIHASRLEKIDVRIDFRDPEWDGKEPRDNDSERIRIRKIMTVLRDTETRWKSITVVSGTWLPLYKLMEAWTFTHLPSLEYILMERRNCIFGMRNVRFDPRSLISPMTLFGRNASLPKLRDLSLSAVHVDWDDASAGYQNLRKLELNNLTYDVEPSFEQFAAMLSSSPRLEHLDVSGFCPNHHTAPAPPGGGDPEFPVVHLPALKKFTFGWKDFELGCQFLQMFQIGSSLKSLTLVDTESGLGYWEEPRTGGRGWSQESQEIFEALSELGSTAPRHKNDMPPRPFISMRGVKELKIVWTKAACSSLIRFLSLLTELEDIWLEDVDIGVLEGLVLTRVGIWSKAVFWPLRRVDIQWMWRDEIPSPAKSLIPKLESVWIKVDARAAKEWRIEEARL